MTDDTCGYEETTTDEPCQLPACRSDGRCWHHTDSDARADGGRPSKFTDDRKEAILDAARNGTTVEGCARAGGIHHSTLYDWLDTYPEFSDAFNRARAEGEQRLLRAENLSPEFVLERSYGYTKKEEIEHSGEAGVVIYTESDDGDG